MKFSKNFLEIAVLFEKLMHRTGSSQQEILLKFDKKHQRLSCGTQMQIKKWCKFYKWCKIM